MIIKHEYIRNKFRSELFNITNSVNNLEQYNGTLENINAHSLHGYSRIKNKLINNYQQNCDLVNCYICNHNDSERFHNGNE